MCEPTMSHTYTLQTINEQTVSHVYSVDDAWSNWSLWTEGTNFILLIIWHTQQRLVSFASI